MRLMLAVIVFSGCLAAQNADWKSTAEQNYQDEVNEKMVILNKGRAREVGASKYPVILELVEKQNKYLTKATNMLTMFREKVDRDEKQPAQQVWLNYQYVDLLTDVLDQAVRAGILLETTKAGKNDTFTAMNAKAFESLKTAAGVYEAIVSTMR
ncbi:MAG: hypothetical protein AABZ39_14050 [Spirochaetota bacterium]